MYCINVVEMNMTLQTTQACFLEKLIGILFLSWKPF